MIHSTLDHHIVLTRERANPNLKKSYLEINENAKQMDS